MNYFPLLVALAPLLAAVFTAVPRLVSDKSYKIGFWLMVTSFLASLPVLFQLLQSPEPIKVVLFNSPWLVLPHVELSIDRLAAVMMTVISSIGMVLYRYSIRYLQQDSGQPRYHTLLATAISTLLFMVSSSDLIMLFISWQMLSWLLCLLSHNYAHVPTAQSSFRTFIMLRAGDVAFLAGIALAYHLFGTVQFAPLFERAAVDQTQIALLGTGLEITGATAVTFLIFIGAMSKSAQFPLHMWLPDSLYAPTPIHGLLHAGIINAGGFLLNRLAPLYALSPATLHVVLFIGLATMLYGKSMMLVKNDIKKTLGYSTVGQMGYMMMECGLGAFSLAVFHLIAHGLFKATVFLNCGDVIHKARLEPEHPFKPSIDTPGPLGWLGGFLVSLLAPLAIIIGVHYALGISFLDSQGMLVFLLFSWITASHAMLTLFRVQDRWPTMLVMLVAVTVVSVAYFFGSESFTHFLYPDHSVVNAYFAAAALPAGTFAALAGLLIVSIVGSWTALYLHYHDKFALRAGGIWNLFYLFFINRLYMDGISLRLFDNLKKVGRAIDGSQFTLPLVALAALVFAWKEIPQMPSGAMDSAPILLASALLLPLFPLHGIYVSALSKTPRTLSIALALLLPAAGLFLIPELPPALMPAIGVLAAFGAVWGSVKALTQIHVSKLLSYAGLALYSVLWWHVSQVGKVDTHALSYAAGVTLAIGGLTLAWSRIRSRYGDLDLHQIGGLFRPMPRFALCMALLVMAATGLPPFGLFFSYLGILLNPTTNMSLGLVAIIATWFAASWYLFKLMQRLLFGPHRPDLRYEDLRPAEVTSFVVVIALLVVLGGIPQNWLEIAVSEETRMIGGMLWMR